VLLPAFLDDLGGPRLLLGAGCEGSGLTGLGASGLIPSELVFEDGLLMRFQGWWYEVVLVFDGDVLLLLLLLAEVLGQTTFLHGFMGVLRRFLEDDRDLFGLGLRNTGVVFRV
jgi:hypothetical protein